MKKILLFILAANISTVGAKTIFENVFPIGNELSIPAEQQGAVALLIGSSSYQYGVNYMLNDTFSAEYKKVTQLKNSLEKSKKSMKKLVGEIRLLELENRANPAAKFKRQILDGQKKIFLKNQESLIIVKKQYKNFLKLSLKGSFSQIKNGAIAANIGSGAVIAKFFQNISRTMLFGSIILSADVVYNTLIEAGDEVSLDEKERSEFDIMYEETMERTDVALEIIDNQIKNHKEDFLSLREKIDMDLIELEEL